MPTAILPPVDRDDRQALNFPPIAKRPLLSGDPQHPKGTAQLVMAGMRFPFCRQKYAFQEKPLYLRVRLPCNHSNTGYSAPFFIFLFNPSNFPDMNSQRLGTERHWVLFVG